MLFHITYEFSPENRNSAQERFKETGAPPPEGVVIQVDGTVLPVTVRLQREWDIGGSKLRDSGNRC